MCKDFYVVCGSFNIYILTFFLLLIVLYIIQFNYILNIHINLHIVYFSTQFYRVLLL